MNHLAHLVLAGPDQDHRLGALLGDHVKGRLDGLALSPALVRGIGLHRRIDRWSDTDPAVTGLLAGFRPPWRRYGGIVLDVLFDRELSRRWAEFGPQPLAVFGRDVDRLLARRRSELPPRLARFAGWAASVDLWTRMDDRGMLAEIFRLIALRHGRSEPLARGLDLLDAHEDEIARAFDTLFPRLLSRSREYLGDGRGGWGRPEAPA